MKNTPRHRRRRRLRIECLDRRRVLASISGEVFLDDDHSFIRGQDEQGAASRIVYLDLDDSGNLSDGDPIQITDAAGQFEFADLSDGTYSVRVFDGAASQIQSSPVDASSLGVQAVSGIKQLVSGSGINSSPIAIVENLAADDTLALFDSDGNTTFYPVADSITDATVLPGGLSGARRVLVIGEDTSGDSAWVVDLDGGAVTPVDLSGGQSDDGDGMAVSGPTIQWRQVVVDSDGNGLVLQDPSDLGGGDSPIRRISYDTNDGSFAVDVTNSVATDDTVVVSDDGPRSLLAAPTPGGWSYQLWSNQTGTPIAPPVVLSSTQMPLIFDDAKGLVLVDSANGFEVLDADAGFASIASANAGPSVVSYDPARSLVLAADVSNSMLKFFDFASLKPALETALDFTAIGAPIAVVLRQSASRFRVFGDMGVGTIALEDAAAVVRTIIGNADADGVSFGLKTLGSNTAPQYDEVPSFDVDEDDALELDAPALLDGASDLDGDSFVVLRQTEPGHGSIETSFDGSIRYTPDDDYFGSDSFSVVLSDGMTLSSSVTIQVSVNPMPDSPTGISVTVGTTREDISIGDAIGRVEIFDVDGPGTVGIDIDDGRFAVDQNGDIVLASGGLDFETEPSVSLTVTGTDNETNDTVSQSVSFSVTDANDPVTGILPAEATLKENVAGETVAELTVVDQDLDQEYLFSVDDSRFFVDEFDLRLLPGISVDYEASPNITVNVTVTEDVPGGSVFTGPVVIRVENFPEQPSTLSLSDHTITEFIYGDIVGDVFLDGVAPEARWEFSVNDSQFEFDGTTLKLLDDVFADRRDAQQIIVEVTATDSLSQFNDLTETFVIDVLENSLPGHNADLPNDVNHDGEITPLDALIIINYINAHGAGPVADSDLLRCYDVNGDGMITPLDALLIINFLNTPQTVGGGGTDDGGESEGGGAEGEFIPPQDLLPQTVPSDSIEELSPREFRVQLEATPETQRLIEGAPARRVAIVVRHQHVDDAIVDWETGEEVQSLRLFDGEKITT